MKQENLIADFESEYRTLSADESKKSKGRISRSTQGELYQKYKKLGLSTEDMARIIMKVEGTSGETNLKSAERRINLCIQMYIKSVQTEVDNTQESITTKASDTAILVVETNSQVNVTNNHQNRAKDLGIPTLDELECQINSYIGQMAQNIIRLGTCLIQAREQIDHGHWIPWVEKKMHISRQTANKCIQCAERFTNDALARQLAPTKMMELLALPESDTATFFTVCEDEGTPVQNMTKTELRNKIKQWKNPSQTQEGSAPSGNPAFESEVSTDDVTLEGTASGEPEYVELTFRVAQGDKQVMYQVLSAAIEQSQLSEASQQSVLAALGTLIS